MNTLDPNLQKPAPQEKGLIPEPVKLILLLVLLLAVVYLFFDGMQSKKSTQAALAKISEQVQALENNQKLGDSSVSNQISSLKSDC